MLLPENKRRKTVTLRDVEEIVAKIARIPPKSVSADDKETLRNLEREERLYEAKLKALRAAIDEGDASGVAEGDVFQQVREALHLTANAS